MKKILFFSVFISIFLVFTNCKTKQNVVSTPEIEKAPEIYYTEQVRNDFRAVSEKVKNKFLEDYEATDKQYNILFFTQGYNNDEIRVSGDVTPYFTGKIKTNPKTGLAKNMRIYNDMEICIFDRTLHKTICLNPELLKKHKFVYVMKDISNTEKPFKVTYSDLLRPEK